MRWLDVRKMSYMQHLKTSITYFIPLPRINWQMERYGRQRSDPEVNVSFMVLRNVICTKFFISNIVLNDMPY